MTRAAQPHILLAPLDWGLGHTARCVPIIRHLVARGCSVTLAGNEAQRHYYAQVFGDAAPLIRYRHLRGYGVRYARHRALFLPHLAAQLPRLAAAVRAEHRWLAKAAEEDGYTGVISDNRYGLWHSRIPSVILTHQPGLRSGLGAAVDAALRAVHYRHLERFGQCWIVDVPEAPGLSGALSHPRRLPAGAQHIGLLSALGEAAAVDKAADAAPLLILLSGPEPQRTLLADALWAQLPAVAGPVVFAEGRADAPPRTPQRPDVAHHALLTGDALTSAISGARAVVCRSGYSTLMDLVALGQRCAVLIPTPGQAEQEYLARSLHAGEHFLAARQEGFSLADALEAAEGFPFKPVGMPGAHQLFGPVVDAWLGRISG